MSKIVQASGTLTVQSDTGVTGQGVDSKQLTLGPGGASTGRRYYQAVVSSQVDLETSGAVGAAFEPLDAVDDLTRVELIYLRSTAEVMLRLYALPATALAVAGAFPTGFGGGETLVCTIDGVVVTTTFDVADQTALQCAARINAAMALAGIATPRVTVVAGQLYLTGVSTKVESGGVGQLSFTTTPGSTQLGLATATSPTIADAQGQDIAINGLALLEFPTTGANLLTSVEISGQATVEVLIAGRSS